MPRTLPIALAVLLLFAAALPAAGQGLVIVDLPDNHADRITIIAPPRPQPMPRPEPLPRPDIRVAPLQLKSHQVTVTIKDQVATTRVEHVFHNPSGARLEGTFIFPLPGDASIDAFEMDVNGKMTEAELLDAAKARQIYEDIVRSMQDPALLEYTEAGLLKARVFPIEPNADKHVTLEYTQLLEADSGVVEYIYPLASRSFQNVRPSKMALKVELATTAALANVYCPSHELEIKRHGEHKAVAGYESDQLGDGDLKLYFSPKKAKGDVGLTLFTFRDGGQDVLGTDAGYFMLLASPSVDAKDRKPVAKDVVFVLDTSGSMQGQKLKQAKKALKFCIENLNDDDRFQIIRFATDAEPMFDGPVAASEANRAKANGLIDAFKPIGGTAIEEALTKAIEPAAGDVAQRDAGRPYYVIFLTDGKPTIGQTQTDVIVHNAIERFKAQDKVRVFCFGIGTTINTKLLDTISEKTRAVTEYVLPDEDIEVKVSRFYTKISEPVLANPALAVSDAVTLSKVYPKQLPDLFKGDQLVVVGRYTGSGDAALTLAGQVNGHAHKVIDERAFADKSLDHAFLPRLWATRRIGYLLDEIRLGGESDELKDEVVKLARAFGVVTPYTSYLIVEDESRRNVPVAQQTFRELGRDDARKQDAQLSYDAMAEAEAGAGAVRGAQSNASLKSARSAPAATAAADDYAKLAVEPADRARLDTQATVYRNGKTFVLNGGQWTDTDEQARDAEARQVERVVFNSARYFEIVNQDKDAAQWLSVGPNMRVVLADRVIEVVAE